MDLKTELPLFLLPGDVPPRGILVEIKTEQLDTDITFDRAVYNRCCFRAKYLKQHDNGFVCLTPASCPAKVINVQKDEKKNSWLSVTDDGNKASLRDQLLAMTASRDLVFAEPVNGTHACALRKLASMSPAEMMDAVEIYVSTDQSPAGTVIGRSLFGKSETGNFLSLFVFHFCVIDAAANKRRMIRVILTPGRMLVIIRAYTSVLKQMNAWAYGLKEESAFVGGCMNDAHLCRCEVKELSKELLADVTHSQNWQFKWSVISFLLLVTACPDEKTRAGFKCARHTSDVSMIVPLPVGQDLIQSIFSSVVALPEPHTVVYCPGLVSAFAPGRTALQLKEHKLPKAVAAKARGIWALSAPSDRLAYFKKLLSPHRDNKQKVVDIAVAWISSLKAGHFTNPEVKDDLLNSLFAFTGTVGSGEHEKAIYDKFTDGGKNDHLLEYGITMLSRKPDVSAIVQGGGGAGVAAAAAPVLIQASAAAQHAADEVKKPEAAAAAAAPEPSPLKRAKSRAERMLALAGKGPVEEAAPAAVPKPSPVRVRKRVSVQLASGGGGGGGDGGASASPAAVPAAEAAGPAPMDVGDSKEKESIPETPPSETRALVERKTEEPPTKRHKVDVLSDATLYPNGPHGGGMSDTQIEAVFKPAAAAAAGGGGGGDADGDVDMTDVRQKVKGLEACLAIGEFELGLAVRDLKTAKEHFDLVQANHKLLREKIELLGKKLGL